MSDSETIIECSDGKAPKKDEKNLRLPIINTNTSTSQYDYDTHLSGKKHLQKLAGQCSNVKPLFVGNQRGKEMEHEQKPKPNGNQRGKKSELEKNLKKNRCEICDIECTNQFHRAIIVKS